MVVTEAAAVVAEIVVTVEEVGAAVAAVVEVAAVAVEETSMVVVAVAAAGETSMADVAVEASLVAEDAVGVVVDVVVLQASMGNWTFSYCFDTFFFFLFGSFQLIMEMINEICLLFELMR